MCTARMVTNTDGLFSVPRALWCSDWCAPLRIGLMIALLAGPAGPVAAAFTVAERELRTAECVAALDARSDELVRQLKSGNSEARPALVATLNAGAAFIGQAYLQGERDEARSQAELSAAKEAQKTLSAAELTERQASCAQEGTRLLAETNGLGRLIIARLVDRRMQKLLGD